MIIENALEAAAKMLDRSRDRMNDLIKVCCRPVDTTRLMLADKHHLLSVEGFVAA